MKTKKQAQWDSMMVILQKKLGICPFCNHRAEAHTFTKGCTATVRSSGTWASDGKAFDRECLCSSGNGLSQ